MSARASHSYGVLSRPAYDDSARSRTTAPPPPRSRPATPTAPSRGSAISSSHAFATRGRRPLPLAAEHQHHPGAAVVGRVVGHRASSDWRPVAPAARAAGVREEVGDVAHPRHRQMLDGARPRPCTPRAVTSAARRSGITTPGGAGALRGAADRPQVLRVLHLVERHQQRVGAARAAPRPRRMDTRRPPRRPPGGPSSHSDARSPAPEALRTSHARQPRLARGARRRPDLSHARARGARAAPLARGCDRRGSRLGGSGISSGPSGPSRISQPRARSSSRRRSAARKSRSRARGSRRASSSDRLWVDCADIRRASSAVRSPKPRMSSISRRSRSPTPTPRRLASRTHSNSARERVRRVEVVGQRIAERIPVVCHIRRTLLPGDHSPERVADALDATIGVFELRTRERQRLAVVAADADT